MHVKPFCAAGNSIGRSQPGGAGHHRVQDQRPGIRVRFLILLLLALMGLAWLNPDLAAYEHSVLLPMAVQAAESMASDDRQRLEREATSIAAEFRSAKFDSRRVDAAHLREAYPTLGQALLHSNSSDPTAFLQALQQAKQQVLHEVEVSREVVLDAKLSRLMRHTHHSSYRFWSVFVTCSSGQAFSYLGIAGGFYEWNMSAGPCTNSP